MTLSPKLSAFLAAEAPFLIEGEERRSGQLLDVHDPSTGKVLAQAHASTQDDVDAAVASASRAFRDGRWSGLMPMQREEVLLKLADLIARDGEDLATLETLEQGKSINVSRMVSVGGAVGFVRYAAGLATKISGRTFDVSLPGGEYTAFTRREPVGVVAAIAPWNFPLTIAIWKTIPALAAGCTVVLKPSELTPLTGIWLAKLALEAGVPPGVFNVVNGTGAAVGQPLIGHPSIAKISFTGSTLTGKAIGHAAIDQMKRFSLELGGKNPAIVLKDADVERTVQGLILGGFLNQGQVCASSSRVYVEEPLYDRFASAFADAVSGLKVGAGLDPDAQINPVVSGAHRTKVMSFIDEAKAKGARIIQGSTGPNEGYYVAPTLVLEPGEDLALRQQEVFGPLVAVSRVPDAEAALAAANDTPYGLASSLWTQNLGAALTYARRIEAGTVWVNTHVFLDANMPFGGMKQSGMGREFGVEWAQSFTEEKSICIAH